MKLDFKSISNFKPCVIAETACGHDGNLKKLIKLIDIASEAGSEAEEDTSTLHHFCSLRVQSY